jgi:hypothetical protein
MASTPAVIFRNVSLLAWQELLPPDGVAPEKNRDIGFASVFVDLENAGQNDVQVIIEAIEIQSSSGKLIMSDRTSREIYLRSLENSEIIFQLSNEAGYPEGVMVKAVVHYQIGEEARVFQSDFVEVR